MTAAVVGEWARLLLASLAASGVKEVVVSPGSRSTPFAWAAATTEGLRCHSVYDERSAAFFALGFARVTGEPALLISTSGSAAANYFPAVVEASLAELPLLVMTADRPLELQDAGAPQTIDQVKLYGDFARRFFDLGLPDPAPASLAALQRIAAQAALAAKSPVPGPVHLNARARKPLEPGPAHTEAEKALVHEVDRLLERGIPRAYAELGLPDERGVEALAERLSRAERCAIVCGPLAQSSASEPIALLAKTLDAPLFAEATSQLRFGSFFDAAHALDGFDWLLRAPHPRPELRPDVLVRFGGTPVSAGVEQLLAAHGPTELLLVTEHGFPDPTSSASLVVRGAPSEVANRLLAALARHAPKASQRAFLEATIAANESAWSAVNAVVSESPFGEPRAVQRAVEAVPKGGLLIVGNSLPVREVDAFVRASARSIGVLGQRGANGIDGVVSGAAGAAVASKRPTVLLVGDVSFVHDLSGLALARRVETPFVIVVLDNDGGRIFEHLPAARLFRERPETRHLWLTPPDVALEGVAHAFSLPYASPNGEREFEIALSGALQEARASIVHVRVPPDSSRQAFTAVFQRLGASEAP